MVGYSKSYVCKLEKGQVRTNKRSAAAFDEALGASGDLAALLGDETIGTDDGFGGLPTATRYFVGRADEVTRIQAVLADRQLGACVLHGMAGVGKTALALRVARAAEGQFPDGSVFLDLSDGTPGPGDAATARALERLLRATGVPGQEIPRDLDDQRILCRDQLRGKRMLLILDNVLHADQIAPVLPAAPGCAILIISRNRLNALDEAAHILVDALPAAPAAKLFRGIAGVTEHEQDETVARIVDYCGRLPLAVRIAAARFKSCPAWTLAEFARRLADESRRLRALDDGERSVSAALNLSYRSLPASQRRMLGYLALHPAYDIDTHAAAALAGLTVGDAEPVLHLLADAHLVSWQTGDRVGFHSLVRLFAAEQARRELPDSEQDAAIRRLLELMLSRAFACDRTLSPYRFRPAAFLRGLPSPPNGGEAHDDTAVALSRMDNEWPSMVALCETALQRGLHEYCWQLAFFLRDYFFRTKHWTPWIETHGWALEAARLAHHDRAAVMTLNNQGIAYADSGRLEDARGNYVEALRLFHSLEDEHGEATTRSNLGWVYLYLGNYAAALRQLNYALEFYERNGSIRNAVIALRGIALTEVETGSFAQALRHAQRAARESRELKLELDAAMALNCVAWVHFQAGQHEEAAGFYAQAAELGQSSGSRYEVARAWTGLGNVAMTRRDHARASKQWSLADESMPAFSSDIAGEAKIRRSLASAVLPRPRPLAVLLDHLRSVSTFSVSTGRRSPWVR